MKNEFEVIEHPHLHYLNIFLVDLGYRTPHFHEDIELILLLNGHATTSSRHEEYSLEPNSAVIFNSNQPHEFHSIKEGALLLCIQVSPKFFSKYYPAITCLEFDSHSIDFNVPKEYKDLVKALIIESAFQYYAKKLGFEFACISLLNQLFWVLLNYIPWRTLSEEESKANIHKAERLNRILNYIDEKHTEKILLSDIAKMENLSMSYLSHFIKDNLNQTFQEYLSNLRFIHAQELVTEKRMKIIDICMECGFSDYRYLYQAFLKNYGCTPKEYQNLQKPATQMAKHKSVHSIETFYTIEETINILTKLHDQYSVLIKNFSNFIFD